MSSPQRSHLTYHLQHNGEERPGEISHDAITESLKKLNTNVGQDHKKPRSHRKVLGREPSRKNSLSRNNSTSISPTTTGPSKASQQPRIHNKLNCDQQTRKVSTKVLSKLGNGDDLRSVKSHTELAETANGVRTLAKNLSKATIQLDVKAIMIVTKAQDNSLIYLTREVVEWLFTQERDVVVYVDRHLRKLKRFDVDSLYQAHPERAGLSLKFWDKQFAYKNPEKFDLVITLGGDGTVLYVSNLFQRVVPPVISFALGSLGFLTNFQFENFREVMGNVIDKGVRAYLRMRFTCRVHKANGKLVCEQQVLNELVIDRGPSPYVTNLELYGDGSLLTIAQADGLIIATPTGSTAYSLSAGGSLVHPGVSAISVTPICPHTLSFRPILLPDGMFLKVKVPRNSRSTAWCSFDGKVRTELSKGDYVTIQASPFPFPTVISSKTEYIDSVSRNLNWNARETQKPLGSLLTGANREKLTSAEPDIDDDGFDICYSSDTSSDEEYRYHHTPDADDEKFLPSPGDGLNTPPPTNNLVSFGAFDDRALYAHPHATISLDESTLVEPRRYSSVASASSDGPITINPKYEP